MFFSSEKLKLILGLSFFLLLFAFPLGKLLEQFFCLKIILFGIGSTLEETTGINSSIFLREAFMRADLKCTKGQSRQ